MGMETNNAQQTKLSCENLKFIYQFPVIVLSRLKLTDKKYSLYFKFKSNGYESSNGDFRRALDKR
jgi:hypothetical protein